MSIVIVILGLGVGVWLIATVVEAARECWGYPLSWPAVRLACVVGTHRMVTTALISCANFEDPMRRCECQCQLRLWYNDKASVHDKVERIVFMLRKVFS